MTFEEIYRYALPVLLCGIIGMGVRSIQQLVDKVGFLTNEVALIREKLTIMERAYTETKETVQKMRDAHIANHGPFK